MVDKKLHPVVELLLARMKSHPEEFRDEYLLSELEPSRGYGRWDPALRAIKNNGSEQDLEAINEALGAIRMSQVHEWAMDELCNGEERRRKEREAREEEEARWQRQAQQAYSPPIGTPGALGQHLNPLRAYQNVSSGYSEKLNQAMEATQQSMIGTLLGKVFK